MNVEKRKFFQGLKLQIGVVDLVPFFCPLVPPHELIYAIEYRDAVRASAFIEDIPFNPPLLPSELMKRPRNHVRDTHIVLVSDDDIKIHTKSTKKTDKGIIPVENTYSFSILDLIDP